MCFLSIGSFCYLFWFVTIIFLVFSGVYDALQKKYLKTLMFCVCETVEGPMIEEYACKIPEIVATICLSV